jgi:hypothetical protein
MKICLISDLHMEIGGYQIVANHRGYEGYETCAKIFDPYRGVIELS